jgi:hypothetical protein
MDALLPEEYEFAKIGSNMFIGGGRIPNFAPIFQFDSQGKFIRQVNYNGRGPNEILTTMEWCANPNLRQVNVVSTGNYMVVVSTDSDEKFTIRINEKQGFERIPLNDSTFVSAKLLSFRSAENDYLYFVDQAGSLAHSIERNDKLSDYYYTMSEGAWAGPYEAYGLWPDYKGDAIFHDIFNDTLYRIKSHREITPYLIFKRGTLSPRMDDKQNPEATKKQVYFEIVMASGDHVFLNYLGG